jgi:hypothetical protein
MGKVEILVTINTKYYLTHLMSSKLLAYSRKKIKKIKLNISPYNTHLN